jgi:hypothetical protein
VIRDLGYQLGYRPDAEGDHVNRIDWRRHLDRLYLRACAAFTLLFYVLAYGFGFVLPAAMAWSGHWDHLGHVHLGHV